jgi:hypothetical protein
MQVKNPAASHPLVRQFIRLETQGFLKLHVSYQLRGSSKEKAKMGAATPKPLLPIPPHIKL